VSNNVAGDAIGMASDGTPNQPTVFAYSLSLNDGLVLKTHGGEATTISATAAYIVTGNDDFMGAFSSQGPTDVDFRVKPDVVAPGVNVLSSIPMSYCSGSPCFAFFQGTSMATPHLAGSAAVVRQQHPDWSAAQVRSAVVNTADQGVLKKSGTPGIVLEQDANVIGAGRENLLSAVDAVVSLDPVSVSFGAVPSGSGQSDARVITLIGAPGATFGVSVDAGGAGVTYSVDSPSVTLGADGAGRVTVRMEAWKGAAFGDHQATLRLWSGSTAVAHAVVYTLIK
jgi:subtilisin family serine protease